jgi:divalent metal cation (Fe/Co/Zn/Cd) transporter
MSGSNLKEMDAPRLLGLTLSLCLLASLLKFIVAWQTRSLAVLSDAAFSLLAVSVHLAALLALWLEIRPDVPSDIRAARKLETGVVMVLSTILALTGWEILGAAYERHFQSHLEPTFNWPGACALLTTGLSQSIWFKLIQNLLEGRWSPLVRAVGWTQVAVTVAALLALFFPALDPFVALAVVAFLARAVFRLVYASLSALGES